MKNGKKNDHKAKGEQGEREFVERFPIEVTVSAHIPVDKQVLPKQLKRAVIFGGEHKSLFRAVMKRDEEKPWQIHATFPEGFMLTPKKERGTYFKMQANEFMRPDMHLGGVVCSPGGLYLAEQANRRDFSLFTNMDHVVTVKAMGDHAKWEIKIYNFKEGSKHRGSIVVLEESWFAKMPRSFGMRFHLDQRIVADMEMPSQEELEKEVHAMVDTLPTEVEVDWSDKSVDLQAKLRPLVSAMVASFRKAAGEKLWYKDVAPEPPAKEEQQEQEEEVQTTAQGDEEGTLEDPIPMPGKDDDKEAAEG